MRRIYYSLTTFQSEMARGFKHICEFLPKSKMPETPVISGFTGIRELLRN
jgi:hypothetical protein